MRYALVAVFLAIAAAVGVAAYHIWNAGPPVVLPAPTRLEAATGAAPLTPGLWTNSSALDLEVAGAAAAGVDVEVRRAGQAFSGSPTSAVAGPGRVAAACGTCAALRGADTVRVSLPDGSYHWQARLHSGQGVSPWVPYRGTIRIDTKPPLVSNLASPTDPSPRTLYHSSTMSFSWKGSDSASGVDGYSYRLDQDPHGSARSELRTRSTAVTLQGLNTGTWYFHVRALDRAGNWGQDVTFPVRIDVTPPGLSRVRFSQFQFDPQYQPLRVSFTVTRAAREVHVGVYNQSNGALVRLYKLANLAKGQQTAVTWDGKDAAGRYAGAGTYEVYVRATDAYGHSSLSGWRDFLVDYKRIVVSLSQQKLWAYDGNSVFLTTLVTTGNPKLPTPQGTFYIEAKFHPFTFHSPWPRSSPYYYAPSLTHWAMLFREGGYFIHDAPWRSVFGPGSNQQIGTPGQNYTGSHGCVNVPSNVAYRLYHWASVGTVVQVIA